MTATSNDGGLSPLLAAGLAIGAVSIALLVGKRTSPSPDHPRMRRWYKRLDKPDFTPPTLVYPIAWTAIQAGLAYGGYRLLRAGPSSERTTALALWSANQIGIAGWSAVFFGQRAPGWGTLASGALGMGAASYVVAADKVDRPAAMLGAPLAAWVSFATVLTEEIWRRNDPVAEPPIAPDPE